VSQQHGFGYNGTEPTGSTKPDDDHDGMQQKGENVAHAQDGIRPKKLKIQGACGIRHPQVSGRLKARKPQCFPEVIDVSASIAVKNRFI
jgi:hypothetical protein